MTNILKTKTKVAYTILIISSFFVIFYGTQLWVGFLIGFLTIAGIDFRFINENTLNTVMAFVIYAVSLLGIIGLFKAFRLNLSSKEIGLNRLPSWADIFITPLGFVAYFVMTYLFTLVVSLLFPAVNLMESQDTGFNSLNSSTEYIGAFITLVLLAPIAEEVLFRGYLFGALRRYIKPWLTILITSIIFGFVHGNINLMIDTFALGLVLGTLRQTTGSVWAPILLHMTKNGLAFYLLFINPGFPL